MIGRNTGIFTFAASALAANAFLLPPNVAPASNGEAGALTIAPGAFNAKQAAISLICSDCHFKDHAAKAENAGDEEPLFWIQGGANNIMVNFTISHDGQRLQVDGGAIWPMDYVGLSSQHVRQTASGVSIKDVEAGQAKTIPLEVTGSGISVSNGEVVSPEGDTFIPIKYSIFGLELQTVSLASISVKLIKAKSGELFIAHVEAEEAAKPRPHDFFGLPAANIDHGSLFPFMPRPQLHERPQGDAGREKECKMLPAALCKLRAMLEDRLRGMRQGRLKHGWRIPGCFGRKGGKPHGGMMMDHIKPNFFRPGQEDETLHRPHHMRPQGEYHDYYHGRHFGHSFLHGLLAVLVPTMAGIAVGMAVSLVGLCFGRLIGFLWTRFYRGGRAAYRRVQHDEYEAAEEDFEKVIVGDEVSEPLPVYEEAPAYEEAIGQEARRA